jgi:hypothetical protein
MAGLTGQDRPGTDGGLRDLVGLVSVLAGQLPGQFAGGRGHLPSYALRLHNNCSAG